MIDDLIEYYQNLLIKQYWEKPNAYAEAGVIADGYGKVYDLLTDVVVGFDLDNAEGHQLDIIGRIIGVPRVVPFVLPKVAFGFEQNPNSRGFASKFNSTRPGAPFQSKFAPAYTPQQLNDFDYRFFIRAKIANNIVAAVIASDERISIQDVINTAFDGRAYVLDNQDMTLTLYVSPEVDVDRLRLIQQIGLLPKPQAVRYKVIVQAAPEETFGFSSNTDSVGFARKVFDVEPFFEDDAFGSASGDEVFSFDYWGYRATSETEGGGYLARKIILE